MLTQVRDTYGTKFLREGTARNPSIQWESRSMAGIQVSEHGGN